MAQVNIYQDGGVWCYAAWVDGEHDCNGTLATVDLTEEQAKSAVLSLYPGAIVTRVSDL
jgi:hypothetical protein